MPASYELILCHLHMERAPIHFLPNIFEFRRQRISAGLTFVCGETRNEKSTRRAERGRGSGSSRKASEEGRRWGRQKFQESPHETLEIFHRDSAVGAAAAEGPNESLLFEQHLVEGEGCLRMTQKQWASCEMKRDWVSSSETRSFDPLLRLIWPTSSYLQLWREHYLVGN
jgi:hypothetical protein